MPTPRRHPNRMMFKQRVALLDLIRAEYAESSHDDAAFARYATVHIGVPVAAPAVAAIRREFSIPPNLPPRPKAEPKRLSGDELADLRAELARALDRINALERFEFVQAEPPEPQAKRRPVQLGIAGA